MNTIDPIAHTHAKPADMHGHEGPPPRSWLDKGIARLVALGIAGVLAVLLVLSLGDDVMALVSGEEAEAEAELVADPRVEACIAERSRQIADMAAGGVIAESQVAEWRGRAVALCRDQPQSAPGLSGTS